MYDLETIIKVNNNKPGDTEGGQPQPEPDEIVATIEGDGGRFKLTSTEATLILDALLDVDEDTPGLQELRDKIAEAL